MNGKDKCEVFRAIRKRICENNNINFAEIKCPSTGKDCVGTCPMCDYWLTRINEHLEAKHQAGKEVDYSGIKEIYDSWHGLTTN